MTELLEKIKWRNYFDAIKSCQPVKLEGRILKVAGIVAEANGPRLGIGNLCAIKDSGGQDIHAEVI